MITKITNDNCSKVNKDNYLTIGTSAAQIELNISLERLVEIIGQPTVIGSRDNKTQLEWIYTEKSFEEDKVITIYDYKQVCSIHNIHSWHVGSKNIDSDEITTFLLAIGFYENEIIDCE